MFVVRMGANHPSLALAPQVPASIYFWLPRGVEWLMRTRAGVGLIPGWISGGDVSVAIGDLHGSRDLGDCARGSTPDPSTSGVVCGVRVYGLAGLRLSGGGCATVCAGDAGGSWGGVGSWWAGSIPGDGWTRRLFVGLAALLWRVHLIDWPFYAVFVMYAVSACLGRKETAVSVAAAAVVLVFCVLANIVGASAVECSGTVPACRSARDCGPSGSERALAIAEVWTHCACVEWVLG